MEIVTANLKLDALRREDAGALFAYRHDPAVTRWQGWKPASVADAVAFIEAQQGAAPDVVGTWWQRAIRSRDSGALVGDLGLHFIDDATVELGITIAPTQQRRGYAGEALEVALDFVFGGLRKHRVIASVLAENVACVRLLEELGMRMVSESHSSRLHPRADCVHELMFELLDREWLAPPADESGHG